MRRADGVYLGLLGLSYPPPQERRTEPAMVCGRPSVGDSCFDTTTARLHGRRKDEKLAADAAERARCLSRKEGLRTGRARALDCFLVNGG